MPYFGISCCYSLTVILLTVKVVFAIQDVESHKITNQSDIYIYIYILNSVADSMLCAKYMA